MAVTRIFGGVLALAMGFDLAPQILLGPDVKGVMWGKLGLTVGIIVPVGAMDSRCELRMPFLRMTALISSGRRAAKLVPVR